MKDLAIAATPQTRKRDPKQLVTAKIANRQTQHGSSRSPGFQQLSMILEVFEAE